MEFLANLLLFFIGIGVGLFLVCCWVEYQLRKDNIEGLFKAFDVSRKEKGGDARQS